MRHETSVRGAALSVLVVAGWAHADPFPSLDLQSARPPMGQVAGMRTESPAPEGTGQLHTSLTSSYARGAVQLPNVAGNDVALVQHQIVTNALLARGFGSWLTLALDLPVAPYQKGETLTLPGGESATVPQTALGDLQLRAKASIVGAERRSGFQWALLATGTAPTGNARSTLSNHALSAGLFSIAELDLLLLRLRASVGGHFRSEPRTIIGERFAHQLPWAVGIVLRPQLLRLDDGGRWFVYVEGFGSTTTGRSAFERTTTPVGLGLSTRVVLGEVSPLLGVELPLNDALGNPRLRIVAAVSWTPRKYDSDHDQIGDERDECPEIAEDKDGYEDSDGCLDHDNDDDGVVDGSDRCPYEREDEDGHADSDGCADPDNDHDRLIDKIDACPMEPGPHSALNTEPGCPVGDRDRDRVLDDVDVCPRRKEDRDGFRDDDGCPELDNDLDGIADRQDRCPNEPGPRTSRDRGCPKALTTPAEPSVP